MFSCKSCEIFKNTIFYRAPPVVASESFLKIFHFCDMIFCIEKGQNDLFVEAIVQRCFVKKVFLGFWQSSQENTYARVSFLIKLQALGLQFYQKKALAQVFSCELCQICKNAFLHRTPLVAVSLFVSMCSSVPYLPNVYSQKKVCWRKETILTKTTGKRCQIEFATF